MKSQLSGKGRIPSISPLTPHAFSFLVCCALITLTLISPSHGGRVVVHSDDEASAEGRRPYPPNASQAVDVGNGRNGTTSKGEGITVEIPIPTNDTKHIQTPAAEKSTTDPNTPKNETEKPMPKEDSVERYVDSANVGNAMTMNGHDNGDANSLSACGWLSNMLGVSGSLFVNSTSNGNWMAGMLPDATIGANLTYTTSVFGAASGAVKRQAGGSLGGDGDLFRVEVGYVFADIGAKVDLRFVPLFDRMMVEVVASPNIRVLPMHVHGAPFSQCHSVWNFLVEYANATQRDAAWRRTINAVSGVDDEEAAKVKNPDNAPHKLDEGLRIPHSIPEAIDMVKRGVRKIQNNLSHFIHRFTEDVDGGDEDHHHRHHNGHHHDLSRHHRDDGARHHHRHAGGASTSSALSSDSLSVAGVVGHKISPFRTSFVFVSAVEAEGSIYVAAEVRGCVFPDKPPNMIEVTGPLTGYGCSAPLCGWTVVGNNDGRTDEERSSWVAYGGPMNMNFTTQWSQQDGWNLTVVPMHSYGGQSLKVGGPHFAHIFASSAPEFDVFNAIITRIV